jgi:hypothetical protein
MKLSLRKTKNMIFNFSEKYHFTTKLNIEKKKNIEKVRETTLLGTVITDRLTWDRNTEELVKIKKGYKQMRLLNAAAAFTNNRNELKDIHLTLIRSILEQSTVVWHSSLSVKNKSDPERVQKAAVRVIMGKSYSTYKNGLKDLKLDTLETRRDFLCLKFAKNCLNNEKMKALFPLNKTKHHMKKRKVLQFLLKRIKTKRWNRSALPQMTRLLNDEIKERTKSLFLLFVLFR